MVFLIFLVFYDIWMNGVFVGYENNKLVLFIETVSLIWGAIYLGYLFKQYVISEIKNE